MDTTVIDQPGIVETQRLLHDYELIFSDFSNALYAMTNHFFVQEYKGFYVGTLRISPTYIYKKRNIDFSIHAYAIAEVCIEIGSMLYDMTCYGVYDISAQSIKDTKLLYTLRHIVSLPKNPGIQHHYFSEEYLAYINSLIIALKDQKPNDPHILSQPTVLDRFILQTVDQMNYMTNMDEDK